MKKTIIGALVVLGLGIMAFNKIGDRKEKRLAPELTEENVYEPIVVLELFTSQGCSSCPSADALLNQVKKKEGEQVFTLSYHVDYWNYIGWEDPFSKPQFAKKQRLYNIKFRNRSNYTPQLVVNGMDHFVGSSASKMNTALENYKKQKTPNHIGITELNSDKNGVQFTYEIEGETQGKTLRSLLVLNERTTQVKRGENRNRTLTNSNIVVKEQLAELQGSKGTMSLDFPNTILPNEKLELIVLVENEEYDITAAAKNPLSR